VSRTWDIQNLARGRITPAMVGSSLLNSSLWVLSSYIGMKGMLIDGSIIHGVIYIITASASAILMTWIKQKQDGFEGVEDEVLKDISNYSSSNIHRDRGNTLLVWRFPWNRK
jgi:hypothetical protein